MPRGHLRLRHDGPGRGRRRPPAGLRARPRRSPPRARVLGARAARLRRQPSPPLALRLGIPVVALGTVADDLGDDRPGIAAAAARGAISPLVEAGLGKAEVRELSRALGLRTWDKPQLACLSSRFPYGTRITPERLDRVDRFEEGLRALGFQQLRVRFHDTIARLELEPSEMERAMDPATRDRVLRLGRGL